MILKEGQFYKRKSGNIFRVIKTNPIIGMCLIRNIMHMYNVKPYTYQSEVKIYMKRIKRIGTEELLLLLANKNYIVEL